MTRGEIYWADIEPRSGSKLVGRHPAVLISHDAFNQTRTWQSLVVIPISTSAARGLRGRTVVSVPRGVAGLSRQSYVLCHQITTLHRGKLGKRIGELPTDLLHEVEQALRAALALI